MVSVSEGRTDDEGERICCSILDECLGHHASQARTTSRDERDFSLKTEQR